MTWINLELENFNETLLPEKEVFYSNLNMEDVTDADYMHAKRVCTDFVIKKHDLYLKRDRLLLAKILKYFEKCVQKVTI